MDTIMKIADIETEERQEAAPRRPESCDRSFPRRRRSQALIAMLLLPAFAGIYYLSYWLRFEGQLDSHATHSLLATIAWVVLVKFAWFVVMKVCRAWNHTVTFYDLVVMVQASTGSMATIAIINYALLPSTAIPRSIFLLDWGATLVILGGARAMVRGFREKGRFLLSTTDQVRVFIIGAGDAGELVLRAVRRTATPTYRVVGFIDDDPALAGTRLDGVPVVGPLAQACQLAQLQHVRQILVIQGQVCGIKLRKLVDDASRCSIAVRVLPSYAQLIDGSMTIQPRPVSIDDLLQREPVHLNTEDIRQWIDDRVITGDRAAGSIGSEICRQLLEFSPRQIVLVDRAETGQFFLERDAARPDGKNPSPRMPRRRPRRARRMRQTSCDSTDPTSSSMRPPTSTCR